MTMSITFYIIFSVCLCRFAITSTYDDMDSLQNAPTLAVRYEFGENVRRESYIPPRVQYVKGSIEGSTNGDYYKLIYDGKEIDLCTDLPEAIKSSLPNNGWVALVQDTRDNPDCTCEQKLLNARRNNATAAVILSAAGLCGGPIDMVAIWVTEPIDRKKLVKIHEETSGIVYCQIIKPRNDNHFRVSKTSVLFVLVSFILLMCISLAWLVFYYVQRFRHMYQNDREARQLLNASKKAISKLKTEIYNSANLSDDENDDSCAVCLETYKDGECIRILLCRHFFHKKCVDPWLLKNRTCPMCKSNVLKALGVEMPNTSGTTQDDSAQIEANTGTQNNNAIPEDENEHRSSWLIAESNLSNITEPDSAIPGSSQASQAWPDKSNIMRVSPSSSTSSMVSEADCEMNLVSPTFKV